MEGDVLRSADVQRPHRRIGKGALLLFRGDGVGGAAGKPQQHSAVGCVADRGQCKRAVQVGLHTRYVCQHTGFMQAACKGKRGAHGTDRMRRRGADTDFEELEKTGHC